MTIRPQTSARRNDEPESISAYWEFEVATGAIRWSPALLGLLGYSAAEVTSSWSGFVARVHPDDRAVIARDKACFETLLEFRMMTRAGGVLWMTSAQAIETGEAGEPRSVRGTMSDVTAQRAPAADAARLLQVERLTTNSVVATDPHGRVCWINNGFSRLTGYSLAEARGRTPGELLQGPATSELARATIRAAISAREPFRAVILNYAKTGRQYWVSVEAQPTRDEAGTFTGYIALQSDISEQRIFASREALAARVAALLLKGHSLEVAGEQVLIELVQELDVCAAQLWLVDPAMPTLRYLAGAAADPRFDPWLQVTRELSFRKGTEWLVGVGSPGTAWGSRETCLRRDFWLTDRQASPSRRANTARSLGIRTVCAVPVFGTDGVIAVIEVAGTESFPGYERVPSLLERTAEQLASFILRNDSRLAFESIFRLSPDGLLLVDPDGQIIASNERAEALFGPTDGRPIRALIDGADDLISELRNRGSDRTPLRFERRANAHDGATFPAEITLTGTSSSPTQTAIFGVRDLTDRHRLQAELTESLRAKETLMKEIHHRVKNHLQIISSMVMLQADAMPDPATSTGLVDTVDRIRTMALIHEQLYRHDDIEHVDLGEYAESLCAMLRSSFSGQVEIDVQREPVTISADRAVPCGLILNELITNAFKYGTSADGRCRIHVRVSPTDGGFVFEVADEGVGQPSVPTKPGSIGSKLIDALTRQLRATRTSTHTSGTTVRFNVPRE